MSRETEIMEELSRKFDLPEDSYTIPRARRIFIRPTEEVFRPLLTYLHDNLGFYKFLSITGLDNGEDFSGIYHISGAEGIVINIERHTSKENPVFDTITNLYQGGSLYERELTDLLGIQIEGLPKGQRYPLPEDWPEGQYPLRKDWQGAVEKEV